MILVTTRILHAAVGLCHRSWQCCERLQGKALLPALANVPACYATHVADAAGSQPSAGWRLVPLCRCVLLGQGTRMPSVAEREQGPTAPRSSGYTVSCIRRRPRTRSILPYSVLRCPKGKCRAGLIKSVDVVLSPDGPGRVFVWSPHRWRCLRTAVLAGAFAAIMDPSRCAVLRSPYPH